jgi:hypothetical protein
MQADDVMFSLLWSPAGQRASEEELDHMIDSGQAENIFQKAILTDQVGWRVMWAEHLYSSRACSITGTLWGCHSTRKTQE